MIRGAVITEAETADIGCSTALCDLVMKEFLILDDFGKDLRPASCAAPDARQANTVKVTPRVRQRLYKNLKEGRDSYLHLDHCKWNG
jgi:hypothetical protein